jgi:hypothetical protein
MARIGVTGHVNLTAESEPAVADAIRVELARYDGVELVGVTCLARGADQIFARVVLELGGAIEVVLPAADYREREIKPENAEQFDDLLVQAADLHIMPFEKSNDNAYMAAGHQVLSTVDALVAVWDGRPSGGYGGTADVVESARVAGVPVTVIWPVGAARTS